MLSARLKIIVSVVNVVVSSLRGVKSSSQHKFHFLAAGNHSNNVYTKLSQAALKEEDFCTSLLMQNQLEQVIVTP